jgi:uroporphyrinogen decarboxylase
MPLLLSQPNPDFLALREAIAGGRRPSRVHPVELLIDEEVLKHIAEDHLGESWVERGTSTAWSPVAADRRAAYFQQIITLYHRLGYDIVPVRRAYQHHPPPRKWCAEDTAELSRGHRHWVDESQGIISSWEELEAFPWEDIVPDASGCEFVAQHMPEGMKITVMGTHFEHVAENLLGFEGLFNLIYDEPELVAEVFARWGRKVYDYYEAVIGLDEVGAIFHADDLGFKTSTFLSPDHLRRYVLPWLSEYCALAHEHDKMFWYHCCGNVYEHGVIDELIEDVGIDAFHSFQDIILPVADFVARYGDRVAALGGVDMDKLARLETDDLRAYIRDILEQCVPRGRFALGSGNTIANYIPLQNYCVLIEEGRRWTPAVQA